MVTAYGSTDSIIQNYVDAINSYCILLGINPNLIECSFIMQEARNSCVFRIWETVKGSILFEQEVDYYLITNKNIHVILEEINLEDILRGYKFDTELYRFLNNS
jgi:hypothetical protein